MRTDELDEVMTDEEDALPRVPWAQKQRQVIAQLEREKWLLTQKLARTEAQLHEARDMLEAALAGSPVETRPAMERMKAALQEKARKEQP